MITLAVVAVAVAWVVVTVRPLFGTPTAPRAESKRPTVVALLGPNPLGEALADDEEVLVLRPDPALDRADAVDWARREAAGHPFLIGRADDDVAFAVVDPGDTLPRGSLLAAVACLDGERVGAVQPNVRVQAPQGLVARLQDLECIGGNEFQLRRRPALGALGLGPAAPVYRLSALGGIAAWPRRAGDDVEVAARLVLDGWRVVGCPAASVGRPAHRGFGEHLRQRTRTIRALLHSSRLAPRLLARGGPGMAAAGTLLAPVGILLLGAAAVALAVFAGGRPDVVDRYVLGSGGWMLAGWYAVLFAPAWVAGVAYWLRQGEVGVVGAVVFGHLYVLTGLLTLPIAWVALATLWRGPRTARRATTVGR